MGSGEATSVSISSLSMVRESGEGSTSLDEEKHDVHMEPVYTSTVRHVFEQYTTKVMVYRK